MVLMSHIALMYIMNTLMDMYIHICMAYEVNYKILSCRQHTHWPST